MTMAKIRRLKVIEEKVKDVETLQEFGSSGTLYLHRSFVQRLVNWPVVTRKIAWFALITCGIVLAIGLLIMEIAEARVLGVLPILLAITYLLFELVSVVGERP